MLKETLTYDDFNDQKQTKDFYFNLSRAEFALLELNYRGGIEGHLKEVIDAGNGRKIMDFFAQVVDDSYGVRSADGTEFIKNAENLQRFRGSGAYDVMLEKVLDDPDYALTFIRGILPGKYQEALRQAEEQKAQPGFRPGARTLPQSEIDKRAAAQDNPTSNPESWPHPTETAPQFVTPSEPVQVPTTVAPQSPVLDPNEVLRGIREREANPHAEYLPAAGQPVEAGDVIAYTNSAPQLNIEEPLAPHEPGYAQQLTRKQARELGLLG